MKIFRKQMICILIVVSSLPSFVRAQGSQQKRVHRVEELFGKWKSDLDGSIIQIGPLEKGDNRTLALKGMYTWGGSYDGKKLQFMRNVHAAEMDGKAPLWAREDVDKQATLWWSLELTPEEDCNALKLTGKWFRGELSWREETDTKTGEVKRTASSGGKFVNPVDVKYTRIDPGEDDEQGWTGDPVILVHSKARLVTEAVADSLHAKESFFIEVRLSNELAAARGQTLNVSLKSRQGGGSRTVTLKENGGRAFKRYDTLYPLALDGNSEVMSRLSIAKEDVIDITAEGVTASVPVFQTVVAQGVYRAHVSLDQLAALYAGLGKWEEASAADKASAQRRLRIISNAKRVMALKDNMYLQLGVASEHLKYLLDPSAWTTLPVPLKFKLVNGKEVPEIEDDPKLPGVSYLYQVEKDLVTRGIANGVQKNLEALNRAMAESSSDIILFGISTTDADSFVTVAFGITPTGQRANMTERLLAGTSMLAPKILSSKASSLAGSKVNKGLIQKEITEMLMVPELVRKQIEFGIQASDRRPILGGVAGRLRSGGAIVTVARRSAVMDQEVDLERLKLPGAELLQSGGYRLQQFDDTCGLTVYEQMRQDVGLEPRTESENMIVTNRQKNGYRAGKGLSIDGLADSLAAQQFGVRLREGVFMSDIKAQLSRGRKVAALVNTAPGANSRYHWVEVKEFIDGEKGKGFIVYGDPWNGGLWKVDSCTFWDRMNRDSVIFARWGK